MAHSFIVLMAFLIFFFIFFQLAIIRTAATTPNIAGLTNTNNILSANLPIILKNFLAAIIRPAIIGPLKSIDNLDHHFFIFSHQVKSFSSLPLPFIFRGPCNDSKAAIKFLCRIFLSSCNSLFVDSGISVDCTILTKLLVSCRILSSMVTSPSSTSEGVELALRFFSEIVLVLPKDLLPNQFAPLLALAPIAAAPATYLPAPAEDIKPEAIRPAPPTMAPPAAPNIAPPAPNVPFKVGLCLNPIPE